MRTDIGSPYSQPLAARKKGVNPGKNALHDRLARYRLDFEARMAALKAKGKSKMPAALLTYGNYILTPDPDLDEVEAR